MRSHSLFCEVLRPAILAQNRPGPPNEAVALHGAGFMVRPPASKIPPGPFNAGAPQGKARRANDKVEHMAKVAFLGLGVMGFPMAGHLVKKGGHEVTVYNRTAAKAKEWADKFGGRTAP